jgi:uncharacterized protein (DUF362 family)
MAHKPHADPIRVDRRQAIAAGGALAAAAVAAATSQRFQHESASVFIARGQRYDGPLSTTIRDALVACGLDPGGLRNRRVLLKPNLVEPSRQIPHMTTHPAVIVAAAEVFRQWGAEVEVGEAPGHVRDSDMALFESGVGEALDDAQLSFADLNYQQVQWQSNRGGFSGLKGIYFPQSVVEADLVVSMPKLKTHHWVGLTCGMKNLYGVLPGVKYGWPKNVLHHHGIPETVADINCTLPRTIAIVDGIDCMEGDGPILGSRKHLGTLLVGTNLPAVDATAARIMGLVPQRVPYLRLASGRLGPLDNRSIQQRGETWESVASPFEILAEPHLEPLKASSPSDLFS